MGRPFYPEGCPLDYGKRRDDGMPFCPFADCEIIVALTQAQYGHRPRLCSRHNTAEKLRAAALAQEIAPVAL